MASRARELTCLQFVDRLRARDNDTWRAFYSRYRETVLRVIQSAILARNWFALQGDEEDVLVETLEKLLTGLTGFRGTEWRSLEAFVCRTAIFACAEHMRKRGVVAGPLDESHTGGPETDPVECAQIFYDAMAKLADAQKSVIRLSLDGYSPREIAGLLKWTHQRVYDQKHLALLALRELLEAEQFMEHCSEYLGRLRLGEPVP
jgi:RNA polymerase sigma factor (sigma-70 family)